MSYFLYILRSCHYDKWYIGSAGDVEKRLKRHNQGSSTYTKKFRPWKLYHTEEFSTKTEALKKEYYLKSIRGYAELKALKQKMIEKGK